MKRIKRVLALAIVAMMLIAIAVIPASAAEARRKPECDCGGKTALVDTVNSIWTTYNRSVCSHVSNPESLDTIQRRTVKRYYECESCGAMYTTNTYQYRTICPNTGNTYN